MELKECVKVFKENAGLFAYIVAITLVVGFGVNYVMPVKYKAELELNVTRAGRDNSVGYQYGDFYRLQADEKFADTVVVWINSTKNRNEALSVSSDDKDLKIKAKRMSPQAIQVSFVTSNEGKAKDISEKIVEIVNTTSESLNEGQKKSDWFQVVSSEPYVYENKISTAKLASIFLLIGAFLGFWTVLFRHYFKK